MRRDAHNQQVGSANRLLEVAGGLQVRMESIPFEISAVDVAFVDAGDGLLVATPDRSCGVVRS